MIHWCVVHWPTDSRVATRSVPVIGSNELELQAALFAIQDCGFVARTALGTINHSLLTIEALRAPNEERERVSSQIQDEEARASRAEVPAVPEGLAEAEAALASARGFVGSLVLPSRAVSISVHAYKFNHKKKNFRSRMRHPWPLKMLTL